MNFKAPIPGMSLTRAPGNAPWEQPPLHDTAEKALAFYLKKFDDEDTLDDLLFSLEAGYPLDALVDFLTSYSVMQGYHSFDVKMLISPILHEYIISLADAAGVEYTEMSGPSREEQMKEKDKKRARALLLKGMNAEAKPTPENMEEASDLMEGASTEEAPEAPEEEAMPLVKRRVE